MENNVMETINNTTEATNKAMKTVTTGQLVGLGAGCALGGAGLGIGTYVGIKALIRRHKEKKEKKDSKPEESKKEEPSEKKEEQKKE